MDDGCKDYGCDFGTSSSTFSSSSYMPESTGGDPDVELGFPPNICPPGDTCWMDAGRKSIGPATPPVVLYPDEITLHLLDSNVVSWDVIYDYSYLPPKPVGYAKVVYKRTGDFQVNPYPLIGMAADEAITELVKALFVEYVKKPLMGIGVSISCSPECPVAYTLYQIGDNISKVNEAITYTAHIVSETVYYSPPSNLDYLPNQLYIKIK